MDSSGEADAAQAPQTERATAGGAFRLIRRYLRPYWGRGAGLALAIFLSTGLTLVNPLIIRSYIDELSAGTAGRGLYGHAGLYIALALAVQLLAVASTWLGQDLGWRATNALRLDLLRSCLGLDLAWHKDQQSGALVERIDGDAKTLMSFFSDFAIRLAGSGLLFIGVIAALFVEDTRAGAAIGLFAALSSLFLLKVALFAVPHWAANRAKSAEFYGYVGERLGGREDLKALGAAGYASERLRAFLRGWFPVRLKANILGYSLWTSSELAGGIGSILSLGLGAWLWLRGDISLGTVYLIYSYTDLVRQPMEQLRGQLENMQKALAGSARILALLDERPSLSYGPEELAEGAYSLRFEQVSFSYEKGAQALKELSFELEAGATLGIVGRTGCGKTSLGRLALRLYDADKGLVILNGRPIASYAREELRRGLAVVTQEVELVAGTLRDNARLWDTAIDDGRILAAFRGLGLGSWLEGFPKGLDHELGSGGVGLSAGQAQLVAMVRVFLRNPGLVVLDEASSRLDPATEALLDEALSALLRGRSALIIAHRLSTLERVDHIMVMEDGRALEYGPRGKLAVDAGGRYAALLRAGGLGLDNEAGRP
jgi:ATP-binding cassette, subfamily B, bacterial